jgi:hypothetical protein
MSRGMRACSLLGVLLIVGSLFVDASKTSVGSLPVLTVASSSLNPTLMQQTGVVARLEATIET